MKGASKTGRKKGRIAKQRIEAELTALRDLKISKKQKRPRKTPFADVGHIAGSGIGGLFGNARLGASLGRVAGSYIGKIFGSGAYSMNQNNLLQSFNDQVPFMHSSAESVTLRHREFIGDVSSSTTFASRVFSVNPGLSATFPWLSSVAENFQEYEFKGLVFEFKSTSSVALSAANTAMGVVALAAQYRADSTAFSDKQTMLNEMWSVDGKPSESFFLPIECAPKENPMRELYVRTGSLPANSDLKFFDLAKVTVATVGSQGAYVVGELWASYDVVLKKPQGGANIGLNVPSANLLLNAPVIAAPLGTSRTVNFDNIGLTVTNTVLTLPVGLAGEWIVTFYWGGDVAAATAGPTYTFAGCTNIGSFYAPNSVSATKMIISYSFTIDNPSVAATITLSANGVFPTTNSTGYLVLSQVNPGELGI
jgi:hypothetical protein